MNPFPLTATTCPLRGSLGETRYTHLHPTGERAVEAALLIPAGRDETEVFGTYFRVFGLWPGSSGPLPDAVLAELAGQLGHCLRVAEMLGGETVTMTSRNLGATFTVQDAGPVVTRGDSGATAFVLRNWGPSWLVPR